MLPRPRITAIDDEQPALDAIANALNDSGAACLKLLYCGGLPEGSVLDQTRVLFVDLHLSVPLPGNQNQHFSTIGGLLRDYIPQTNGPFILIIWTLYPEQVEGLHSFLCDRLQEHKHAIPVQITTLSKIDHIREGAVVNPANLVAALRSAVEAEAHVAALVNWEDRVSTAASNTMAALVGLIPGNRRTLCDFMDEADRLLNAMATEAVRSSNVGKDRFAAVNEALLPILYDRILRLRVNKEDERT